MPYAGATKGAGREGPQMDMRDAAPGRRDAGAATEGERGIVFFRFKDRMIRFAVTVPAGEQKERTRWRALLLVLKAKLEAIASGIVTMEDEFLAQTMTGDGRTVSEHVQPIIKQNFIEGGAPQFQLPAPVKAKG